MRRNTSATCSSCPALAIHVTASAIICSPPDAAVSHRHPNPTRSAGRCHLRGCALGDAEGRPDGWPYSDRRSCAGPCARVRFSAVLISETCENACGKLPSRRLWTGIVLLGEQADIVAQRQQAPEQRARFVHAPRQRIVVAQPVGARQEHPFAGRQAVDSRGRRGAIAPHQAAFHQLGLDGRGRADHPRILGWQEARPAEPAAGWRRARSRRSTA